MGKNVVIFSDGTGQAGGFRFDEKRSNIYKLYRATRCGPDSSVDPREQVTFYDPGLGSQGDGGHLGGRILRWIHNTVAQATGFGITRNIIDCYSALIQLWRPGDRIILFGFSRGAYTIRCLGGVIARCGIPTHPAGQPGQPLKMDASSANKLAAYAVKHVYQFTYPRKTDQATSYQRFLLDTREKLASRFRTDYGSADDADLNKANVFWGIFIIAAVVAAAVYVFTHLKCDFSVPGYDLKRSLRTIHFNELWMKFYDQELNPNVRYARHAISIDENRKNFQRVPWYSVRETSRDEQGIQWFEQVWFSGNHSDIGGSYPENDSRLSDITLGWMFRWASVVPGGLKHDPSVLKLWPYANGPQHDEVKIGFGFLTKLFGWTWSEQVRTLPSSEAVMHCTVYERFDLEAVQVYDAFAPYRPVTLAKHNDFARFYAADASFPANSLESATALADEPRQNLSGVPRGSNQ